MRRRWGDRGSVTAEFAVALPAALVVLVLAVGALGAAGRQVRLQDAAADAARLVARGEPERAEATVAAAVGGASASVADDGDTVCVTATAASGLRLPLPPLTAVSCALAGGR